MRLLEYNAIESTDQLGYSYGADRAAAVSATSEIQIDRSVLAEPASVTRRGLRRLVRDFQSTDAGYREILTKADTPLLADSRRLSESFLTYVLALARLSNIALAGALSKDGFEQRTSTALHRHPEMRAHIVWGSES